MEDQRFLNDAMSSANFKSLSPCRDSQLIAPPEWTLNSMHKPEKVNDPRGRVHHSLYAFDAANTRGGYTVTKSKGGRQGIHENASLPKYNLAKRLAPFDPYMIKQKKAKEAAFMKKINEANEKARAEIEVREIPFHEKM